MTVPLKVRRAVLARSEDLCERCSRPLGTDYSLHHRRLKQGRDDRPDTNTPVNLIALHGSGTTGCHHLVHSRRLEVGEPGGFIVPQWADPAAVPVRTWRGELYLLPDGGYGHTPTTELETA